MADKIKSFTQLKTWQEGHKLVLIVHKLVNKLPKNEECILKNQILRATISITSNIAEGFGRQSKKEKKQFYSIARGSISEMQNQLLIIKDVGYIKQSEFSKIADQTVIVHKLLNGLIRSIS